MKVSFVGDASSIEAASAKSAAALDNVSKAVTSADVTWREFVGQRMGNYMKQFGSHGAAIQQIATEWKAYKGSLEGVSSSTVKVSQSISQASAKMAQSAGSMGGSVAKGANQANLAMVNLGRVLQDAPYGFIGIANNLNPLLESFQRLKAETGTSGAALKAITTSLVGGGGLGLALSAVTAVMQFASVGLSMWTRGMHSSNSASEKTVEALKNIKASFNSLSGIQSFDLAKKINLEIAKGAAADAGPAIANIEKLQLALTNVTLKTSDRKKALEDYNKVAADANKLQETDLSNLDKVNVAINRQIELLKIRSLIKGAQDQLAEQFKTIFEAQFKTQTALEKANPSLKTFADLMGTAAEDSKDFSTGLDFNKSLNASKQLGFNFFQIQKGARAAGGEVFNLLNFIDGLIKQADSLGGAFDGDKNNGNDKDKFGFLFDFLPFDPSGKLKPEQKSQLLDAADKFSKEFTGIFKGLDFATKAKTEDEKIKLAIKFDADLKSGNVRFDLSKIKEATEKAIKPEDILPDIDKFTQTLPQLVVDQFIRGFQNESERIKGLNLFGNLLQLDSPQSLLAGFQQQLKRVGGQIPRIIEATNIFGDKITLPFDQLFDTNQVNVEGIREALRNAFSAISKDIEDFNVSISKAMQQGVINAFAGFGEALGTAIGGGNIEDVLRGVFQSLGGIIKQLGVEMIALSPLVTALKTALHTLSPAGLIAAGVGLVALGSLVSTSFAKTKKFATGGFVPGIGNSDTVPALLTPGEYVIPKNKVADYFNRNANYASGPQTAIAMPQGQWILRGKDLVFAINQTQKSQRRAT